VLNFAVKNLGRIAAAEISLAPLTILVGKNNTGKSYLASLIWALATPGLLTESGAIRRRPSWFTNFVGSVRADTIQTLSLDEGDVAAAMALVERSFNKRAASLLSLVFSVEGFSDTRIKLNRPKLEPIEFSFEPYRARVSSKVEEAPRVGFYVKINGEKKIIYALQVAWFSGTSDWIADLIFQEVIGYCLFGKAWQAYRNQTYIPAARTGIMLALPSLVSQSIGSPGQSEVIGLPRPLTMFLSKMTEGNKFTRVRPTPIRDRLRQQLLRGQIATSKDGVSDFRYTPEGMDLALPLYATSSMITELAPFLVALQNEAGTHHFIFEEPEAHLHLEAQREMARLIARLVAAGTPVTLTTHSDTFLQQINNLMVLSEHPEKDRLMAELGYEENDLIPPRVVEAYEFCPSEEGTNVKRLDKTDDGFVVGTLNETLLALAQETMKLRSGRGG